MKSKTKKSNAKLFIIISVVVILLISFFVVASNYARGTVVFDGISMEPTIHNGQRVTVEKYPPGQTPHRGDLVEFVNPEYKPNSLQEYKPNSIQRVIALPGERITVLKGKVLVYNSENKEGFNPDTNLNIKELVGGRVDITLKDREYFLMGDNRSHTYDSRLQGPVSIERIIGKVSL